MTLAMFLLAILVSTLGRIFGEDAKTLIPRFSRDLLRRAALRINPAFGPGFYEEWVAHLEDTPELTLKLWHALSIHFWGAGRICREIGYSDAAKRRYDMVKRLFDLSVVVPLVPTALLVIMIAVLAGRARGMNPLYWKNYRGRDGRQIRILRIYLGTPLGRVLRQTRIDEITMIWNVLRGDLSLVGPRLSNPARVESGVAAEDITVKPGISGWSQVNREGKSESECAKLDEEYCERRSFVFDLWIIWMSMVSVFLRR